MANEEKNEVVEEITETTEEQPVEETKEEQVEETKEKSKNEILDDGTVKVDLRNYSEEATKETVEEPVEEKVEEQPVEEVVEATSEGESSGEIDAIMSDGDRKLVVLFGSQSGNSEDLAFRVKSKASERYWW